MNALACHDMLDYRRNCATTARAGWLCGRDGDIDWHFRGRTGARKYFRHQSSRKPAASPTVNISEWPAATLADPDDNETCHQYVCRRRPCRSAHTAERRYIISMRYSPAVIEARCHQGLLMLDIKRKEAVFRGSASGKWKSGTRRHHDVMTQISLFRDYWRYWPTEKPEIPSACHELARRATAAARRCIDGIISQKKRLYSGDEL